MPIALAVKRCESGKDKFLAQMIGNEIKNLTTFTFEELAGSAIQDGGALGVARELGVEDLVCLMHDNNKLGESGVGSLVRTKKKKAVNPFPAGQALIAKFRTLAKHFSYADRLGALYKICDIVGAAKICPKLDKCTTRVMAIWRLLWSMIRLWKALDEYVKQYNNKHKEKERLTRITLGEWQAAAEMEASLNVTRTGCFLSQCESLYSGGYTFALKQLQIDTLCETSLKVIDLPAVSRSRHLHRADVQLKDFTSIGIMTLQRTLAEASLFILYIPSRLHLVYPWL